MRSTVIWSFSMPPEMAEDLETIMVLEQRTKSELMREALRSYVQDRKWTAIQEKLFIRARAAGVRTEDDVEDLVDSLRS